MILGALLLAAPWLHAQTNPEWTTPIAPFHIGGTVLIAHKTAGHTRGCTTWTMKVKEAGRPLTVVIVGSWNVNPGWRLVDRPEQPAGMLAKLDRIKAGANEAVWIDPEGYQAAVAEREQAFQTELKRQEN